MWVLSLGPSQDLAPFPADPKRQTLAMGPHQTGKRPWESVFLFFLKIAFPFWVLSFPANVSYLPAHLLPTSREDGGARCMSERRGQTDQIEGLSTSVAICPVPSQTTTCPARRPTSL